MWEYTTSSHGLPIGAFFRGKSARNAYRRNEDYSIKKGNSTVVFSRTIRTMSCRDRRGHPSPAFPLIHDLRPRKHFQVDPMIETTNPSSDAGSSEHASSH